MPLKFNNTAVASLSLIEPSARLDASTALTVLELGDSAAEVLFDNDVRGYVYAVFDRSLYVCLNQQLLCIGLPNIQSGALNVLLNSSEKTVHAALGLTRAVQIGSGVYVKDATLTLDNVAVVVDRNAAVYSSELNIVGTDKIQWQTNALGCMSEQWAARSALQIDQQSSLFQKALLAVTEPPINAIRHWLNKNISRVDPEPCPKLCVRLLGAGVGTTPSGDDFLMGVLLALHVLGKASLKQRLWQRIGPNLSTRTNKISASYLGLAYAGRSNIHLRRVIEHVLEGGGFNDARAAESLNQMGCSSGWDTFYGIAVVFIQVRAHELHSFTARHRVCARW